MDLDVTAKLPQLGERDLLASLTSGQSRGFRPRLSDQVLPVAVVYLPDALELATRRDEAKTRAASQAAVAAQYSFFQLWNPATSGVDCYVTDMIVGSTAVAQVWIKLHSSKIGVAVNGGGSKFGFINGSMGHRAEFTSGTQVAPLYDSGQSLDGFYCPANNSFARSYRSPIKVAPGWGLVIAQNTVNLLFACGLQWLERRPVITEPQ